MACWRFFAKNALPMLHRLTLADFVDEELRRSDSTFAVIVDTVLKQLQDRMSKRVADEAQTMHALYGQRGDFIRRAVQSLREQTLARQAPSAPSSRKSGKLELSLVDDDEITADIEVARIVERSSADLEESLRELRTYTSALVGDVNTARDTNPLRPEVWVRAVQAAARSLPLPRNLQTLVLRHATQPLIDALRDNYAAACSRLHAMGITPAAHRTVVNEGVVTELTDAMRARRSLDRAGVQTDEVWLPESVHNLLHRVEQVLVSSARHGAAQDASHTGAPAPEEQHTVERLSQLYDAILADRRLPRDSLPLLSRLYPAVLRQTLADADVLASVRHPVWLFMDQLGFLMQTREVGDRRANVAFAQGLVEQLVSQAGTDARPFQTAANRLVVFERQRFARAVSAAAAYIARLSAETAGAPGGHAASLPLDAGIADLMQAPMRRGGDAEHEPDGVVNAWRAGSWLSIVLRGHWRRALILWRAPIPGPLLLLDANEARHWAVRSVAIERLAAAGLARVFSPRSLVGDASGRIGHVSRDPGPTLFG